MKRAALILLAGALAPLPLLAQDRSAAERQTLLELAHVLGEAHALKVACDGRSNQTWRNRMARVIELEAPDEAFRRRLMDRFNTGFVGQQATYTACSAETRDALRRVAGRGQDLALGLAPRPSAMAETAAPR